MSGVNRWRARESVVLLRSPEVSQCVIECKEVSSRIMWMKVDKVGQSCMCLCLHIILAVRDETEREVFWNDLDECLESSGENVSIVLLNTQFRCLCWK